MEDTIARTGDVDEPPRVIDSRRDRLLDQHIAAGFEELARDVEVGHGRRRDDGAVDLARERGDGIEALDLQCLRDVRGDRVIPLDEADDIRLRHLRQDSRVQPAEVAGADDTNPHRMMPRFDSRTNSTRYRASGKSPSSSSIFCSASSTRSFERIRMRYARCSASTVSFEKPLRSRPMVLIPYERLSRLATVFAYGITSCVIIEPPPTNPCSPTRQN